MKKQKLKQIKTPLKRKIIYLISTILVVVYIWLYLNKIQRYWRYEKYHSFGSRDALVLHTFYKHKGYTPVNANELKQFLIKNQGIFEGHKLVAFLVKYNFNIYHDTLSETYYVYEYGPNYRDDKMRRVVNSEDINILNFLFKKGDVLLFYSSREDIKYRIADSTILIDTNRVKDFIKQ